MQAMIRRYRMATGSVDDLMHRVDTEFADQLQEELGMVGYQAVDTGDGTIVTVALFEDEQALQRARVAAADVRHGLAEFDVTQIDAFSGPVMVARTSERLLAPIRR